MEKCSRVEPVFALQSRLECLHRIAGFGNQKKPVGRVAN